MKRGTFISLMGVMAAAGVLSLTGCSSKTPPPVLPAPHR